MGLLCPLILATENQAGFFVFLDEPRDNWERRTQETLDFRARAIAHSKQNDFGWTTQEYTAFFEIRIFGNYGEAVCLGIFPDRRIVRTTQAAWRTWAEPGKRSANTSAKWGDRFSSKRSFTRRVFPVCARDQQRKRDRREYLPLSNKEIPAEYPRGSYHWPDSPGRHKR